ncbi:MAG: hypothetical protein LBB94_06300 [Clostridiales bacterium]|jgi:hypothetical protein|nr:hypothetical protein [Clostridiales bacterium]
MDDKVVVIDENNVKVGRTYNRRARQLVGKQRAVWADETHTAILLSPTVDVHEWQEAELAADMGESAVPAADGVSWDERRLYILAVKKVHERRSFIWHTAAFVPGYIALFIIFGGILDVIYYGNTEYIFCFFLGVWTTAYAIHAYSFIKPRLKNYKRRSEAQRIDDEMRKLKIMAPDKIRMELERAEL